MYRNTNRAIQYKIHCDRNGWQSFAKHRKCTECDGTFNDLSSTHNWLVNVASCTFKSFNIFTLFIVENHLNVKCFTCSLLIYIFSYFLFSCPIIIHIECVCVCGWIFFGSLLLPSPISIHLSLLLLAKCMISIWIFNQCDLIKIHFIPICMRFFKSRPGESIPRKSLTL